MIIFISSSFRDLVAERAAVQAALFQSGVQPSGMEFFVSSPDKPLDVCLEHLRAADAVVLLIGGRAGSFIPGSNEITYTKAEFREAVRLTLPVFPFILQRNGDAPNDEEAVAARVALETLRTAVKALTPAYFSNIDQLKLEVVTAFQVWTKKGRPGSRKTFASLEEHFAAFAPSRDRPRLFDFTQTLVGREQQLNHLLAFVTSPHSVAVLIGRGGIGKTKLLLALAQSVNREAVTFLRRGAIWHRESEKELPAGDLLMVADDAQRDVDLVKLVQCFLEVRRDGRKVRLIISCRSSGLSTLDGVLAKMLDPTDVVRFPPLTPLAITDVRRLAQEELGPSADPGVVEWLVSVSADTPLVTVVAARLIKRQNLHPSEVKSSEEFQRIVFDRFVDELDAANQPFPTRKLVELAAALRPESFDSDALIRETAAYLRCESHEVRQSLQWLEDRGLLIWDGRGGLRIAPDALADRILERCCVFNHQASGFAEFVLHRFGAFGKYGQILANFAEVDWRLMQASEGKQSILDGIWSELVEQFQQGDAATRCQILSTIQNAAIYKPARALEVCGIAMSSEAVEGGEWYRRKNADVLNELPEILGAVSHHSEITEGAIALLLDLWRKGVCGAAKEAKNLAKLRPIGHQPQRTGQVLQAIEPSVQDPSLYGPDESILDLIDEILEREIEWTRGSETAIELLAYRLPYAPFKQLRQRCFALLEGCLASNEPKVAMRALESLIKVLDPLQPKFGREVDPGETAWQDDERLIVIGILSLRALDTTCSLPLQQQIFASLRRRDRNWYSPRIESALRALMAERPDSGAFSAFDAFVTPPWSWEPKVGDLVVHDERYAAWVDASTDRLIAHHPTPDQQIARLEELTRLHQHAGIKEGAAFNFVLSMCRRHPKFLKTFIDYVCNSPLPALGYEIRAVIGALRNSDFEMYVPLARRLAAHPIPDVALGVGAAIGWSREEGARAGDLDVIELLAKHADWRVRVRALSLAGRAGHQSEFARRAAGVLASIDVAHSDLGWEFWSAIGKYGTAVEAFSEEQIRAVLRNVVQNERIDRHQAHCDELLGDIAAKWPHLIVELLINRLEQAPFRESSYSPWGGLNLDKYFQGMRLSTELCTLLRRIRNLGVRENASRYLARELFWALAGNDDRADSILCEWLTDDNVQRRDLARSWTEDRVYNPPRVHIGRA